MLSGGDVPQLWSLNDTLFLGQGLWSRYYHCSCLSMKLTRDLPLPSERHGNAVCTRQVTPCLVPMLLPCFTTSSMTLNPIMRYSGLSCLPTRMGTIIGSDCPYSPTNLKIYLNPAIIQKCTTICNLQVQFMFPQKLTFISLWHIR